jgi:hypothetical protein
MEVANKRVASRDSSTIALYKGKEEEGREWWRER